ncbi:hypothetical protein [Herbaspirillum sp. RV1423]|uniref:hypothetical protein n=1 Tax=Herbaspirillum sp. RV1423 TaxID=1443993 RepID=UPI0004B63B34|nr:hypothetical protein [Herbaspirillum sp. RV1423]
MHIKHIAIAATLAVTAGAAFAEGGVYPPETAFVSTTTRAAVIEQIRANDPNMARTNAYPVAVQPAPSMSKHENAMQLQAADKQLYQGA